MDHAPDDGPQAEPAAIRLPPELAMLTGIHAPAPMLLDIAKRARKLKVLPTRALFASGVVRPQPYTVALARFWRTPVMERPLSLDPATRTDALAAGFARLADGRWLIATDSSSLPRLMQRAGTEFGRHLVLASPTTFRARVRRALAAPIAEEASLGLARHRPDLSYHQGPAAWQKLLGAGLIAGLLAVVLWPHGLLAGVGLLGCSLLFLATILIHIAVILEPDARKCAAPPQIADEDLPHYGILVPLHREVRIVPALLESLNRLAYPREKLDIRLLVEATDQATYAALQVAGLPPWMQIVVVPPGQPQTKPRALNAELIGMTAEFVVIYDAEDDPDPMQLREAVAQFRQLGDAVVCLQGRLAIDNIDESRLTALFAMEYAGLFEVIKPGLARLGLPVPLGGTSNHFRRAGLVKLGGWDAWNVTEDADLGIRIARAGLLVADLPSVTYEEAPSSLAAWLPQRRRWLKGWLQTIITHTRSPWRSCRELGLLGSLAVTATIGSMVAGALGFPIMTGIFLARLLSIGQLGNGGLLNRLADTIAVLVFAGGVVSMAAPVLLGLHRRKLSALVPAVLLLPFYSLLSFIAAWQAVLELIRAPSQWNKTDHGLGMAAQLRRLRQAASGKTG